MKAWIKDFIIKDLETRIYHYQSQKELHGKEFLKRVKESEKRIPELEEAIREIKNIEEGKKNLIGD